MDFERAQRLPGARQSCLVKPESNLRRAVISFSVGFERCPWRSTNRCRYYNVAAGQRAVFASDRFG